MTEKKNDDGERWPGLGWRIVGSVLLVVAITLTVLIVTLTPEQFENFRCNLTRWSALWELLAALGTVAAVWAAVWAATRERRDRKVAEQELQDLRGTQEREKRELYSRRVIVTWQRRDYTTFFLDDATVVNYSDAPVLDVSVHSSDDMRFDKSSEQNHLAPLKALHARVTWPKGQIPSEKTRYFVRFTDINGVAWERWDGGSPILRSDAT